LALPLRLHGRAEGEDKMMKSLGDVHKYIVVTLMAGSLGASTSGAAGAAPPRKLTIIQVYATAETTTSAAVVWNTNVASDSRVQYSTINPIPPSAPTMYSPNQVTYHDFPLTELVPGTFYYFKVTSCAKRVCVTATGSFETYPSCPDTRPPVSGTWQKAVSANVSGVTNQLSGIAALSANNVWAVGWAGDPDGPLYVKRTLIQHFDGSAWRIVPSPNVPNDTHSELYAVSAASADDVWAVGGTHDGTLPSRTLIQHWNGTRWTIVPSPSPANQLNELRGVAALSANDVWAVGYTSGIETQEPIDTLILHWDGVSWTRVESPNITGGANELFGIAAISANDIWSVGYAGGAPLSMHWNGSTWSIAPMRVRPGLGGEWLAAVSGSASNDVWAVGTGRGFFTNRPSATIRHWDGTRWKEKVCYAASSSNPPPGYEGEGGPDAYLTGVSAVASNDVWAVGASGSGPLILHWDGSAWTTVTHPRAFPNSAVLRAVATSSEGGAWSAGIAIKADTGSVRTLIHRYLP
jgi:hypothetical protein